MNKPDLTRDYCMLEGPLAKLGYDWWWHSFTAEHAETGERKPFYIEFYVCNPDAAKDHPVIVWDKPELRDAGVLPSYLMVNVGFWGAKEKGQLHRFFSWSDAEVAFGRPVEVMAADCSLTETYTKGSVEVTEEALAAHPEWMCDAGSMSWDIHIMKQVAFNVGYGASKPFRKLNSFQMFWHAQGMKTFYSGEIILNGQRYIVRPETCFGYADKNWGSDYTSPWVWLASSNLRSTITGRQLENSCFDIGGGCPRVYGVSLGRQLLGAFFYEGKNYEFNFSKLWTGCRTQFDFKQTDDLACWQVTMTTFTAKLELELYCEKEDMIFINYEAPNGIKRFNHLWNSGCGFGIARLRERSVTAPDGWRLVDEMMADNVGCEYGEWD